MGNRRSLLVGIPIAAMAGIAVGWAVRAPAQQPPTGDPAGFRPLIEALYTPEMQRHGLGLAGNSAVPPISIPGIPEDMLAEMMRILGEETEPYLADLYVASIDALVEVHYKYLGEAGVAELLRMYETPIGKRILETQEAMMIEYFEQTIPQQEAILAAATEAAITRAMTEIYGLPAPK